MTYTEHHEAVPITEQGIKHDQDKTRYDLVPKDAEARVAAVYTHGAKKYGDRNWQHGLKVSRLYAAMRRHLEAFRNGEDVDPDSGLSHIDHAECCVQMMRWTVEHKPEFDDRKDMI